MHALDTVVPCAYHEKDLGKVQVEDAGQHQWTAYEEQQSNSGEEENRRHGAAARMPHARAAYIRAPSRTRSRFTYVQDLQI